MPVTAGVDDAVAGRFATVAAAGGVAVGAGAAAGVRGSIGALDGRTDAGASTGPVVGTARSDHAT